MSEYGECYKCSGDLTCPECESTISTPDNFLPALYQMLTKELSGKLSDRDITILYANIVNLMV